MTTNPFIDLSDALAPGRFCSERCSHGGACSRLAGHPGNHQAGGFAGRVYCEWTPDGIEVAPGPKEEDA